MLQFPHFRSRDRKSGTATPHLTVWANTWKTWHTVERGGTCHPALGRLSQENHELEGCLGYKMNHGPVSKASKQASKQGKTNK